MNIHEIAERVGKTGDDILDCVRLSVALGYGNPDDVKEVSVVLMEPSLRRRIMYDVYPKACYHNTWEAMDALRRRDDVRYVLGYWHSVIPVEHCFLKVGDIYHDPTGEFLFPDDKHRYFSLLELSRSEVMEIKKFMRRRFRSNDHIGICEYRRWLADCGGK